MSYKVPLKYFESQYPAYFACDSRELLNVFYLSCIFYEVFIAEHFIFYLNALRSRKRLEMCLGFQSYLLTERRDSLSLQTLKKSIMFLFNILQCVGSPMTAAFGNYDFKK